MASGSSYLEQIVVQSAMPLMVSSTNGVLKLSWESFENANFYRVWCGLRPDAMCPATEGLVDCTYSIEGLRPGVNYFLQVTAVGPFLQTKASVTDDGTGTLVATQMLGFVVPEVKQEMIWAGSDQSDLVTLSANSVLASIDAIDVPGGQFADVFSTELSDDQPAGYIEVQVLGGGVGFFAGLSDNPTNSGPLSGFMWQSGFNNVDMAFVADNDGISQVVRSYPNQPDFSYVIGMVVDGQNLQAWFSLNGQFWDSASQTFKSSYIECAPATLQAGGRTVQVLLQVQQLE